ncbi:MFS transporter [Bradyrhizobium tropiciagri]|uniref:MFS transporter n=1 Tax=Bradyrhizobium tropiciagri TaxID=312253 RepID=UPI001BA76BED|nr:MFS transporter [Bradyrhizobium tropiciagri]MBR0869336.1 MFS transporter [Bradyrhizobium tropiciagri]
MQDETSPRYAGWRVVFACFLLALSIFGFALYGQGVYLVELQRLNGWPASLISGASTLSLLIGNVIVIFTDEIVARLGLKRLALAGIASLAGSMALLAIASAPWMLYVAFALMSLGWVGMGTVVISALVGAWFEKRRGLAISLAFLGASSGGVIVTPLLVLLVTHVGFQAAMLTAAAVMLAVLVPVTLAWVGPPPASSAASMSMRDPSKPSESAATGSITRGQAVRQLAFWTIAIPFALGVMAQVGFIVHQIAMLEPKVGPVRAGVAVSVMTAMAIVGRLSLGVVADRLDPRLAAAASLFSQAVALATISQTDDVRLVLAASALFGFSVGNLITLPPLIIHREFDAASFTVVMGLFTAISGTLGALGPVLIGLVRGWSGGYGTALVLSIGLEVVAAVIVAGIRVRSQQRPAPS